MLCYVYVYVRIVEVEEYLDAKSDDTRDGIDWKKRYSRFPLKRSFFLGRRKPRWQKKKKKRSRFKIAKKIVLSPVLEKDFVSCDTLLGACRKVIYWCNRSRVVHKFFEGD